MSVTDLKRTLKRHCVFISLSLTLFFILMSLKCGFTSLALFYELSS